MTTEQWIILALCIFSLITATAFLYMWQQAVRFGWHGPHKAALEDGPASTHVELHAFEQKFGGVVFVSRAYHDAVVHHYKRAADEALAKEQEQEETPAELRLQSYREHLGTLRTNFEKADYENKQAAIKLSQLFHDHSGDGADLPHMVELVIQLVKNKEQALKLYADYQRDVAHAIQDIIPFEVDTEQPMQCVDAVGEYIRSVEDERDQRDLQVQELRERLEYVGQANRAMGEANEKINIENEKIQAQVEQMQEYQQVAALVCHEIDILHEVATQGKSLDRDDIVSLIKELYDNMKTFQNDAKAREERFKLANSLMNLAASGAVKIETIGTTDHVDIAFDSQEPDPLEGVAQENQDALNKSIADMLSKPPFTQD